MKGPWVLVMLVISILELMEYEFLRSVLKVLKSNCLRP
jgi:hypothetical protein